MALGKAVRNAVDAFSDLVRGSGLASRTGKELNRSVSILSRWSELAKSGKAPTRIAASFADDELRGVLTGFNKAASVDKGAAILDLDDMVSMLKGAQAREARAAGAAGAAARSRMLPNDAPVGTQGSLFPDIAPPGPIPAATAPIEAPAPTSRRKIGRGIQMEFGFGQTVADTIPKPDTPKVTARNSMLARQEHPQERAINAAAALDERKATQQALKQRLIDAQRSRAGMAPGQARNEAERELLRQKGLIDTPKQKGAAQQQASNLASTIIGGAVIAGGVVMYLDSRKHGRNNSELYRA